MTHPDIHKTDRLKKYIAGGNMSRNSRSLYGAAPLWLLPNLLLYLRSSVFQFCGLADQLTTMYIWTSNNVLCQCILIKYVFYDLKWNFCALKGQLFLQASHFTSFKGQGRAHDLFGDYFIKRKPNFLPLIVPFLLIANGNLIFLWVNKKKFIASFA